MALEDVTVSLSDEAMERLAEVEAEARKLGFHVTGSFEDLGVMTGRIEQAKVAELRRVRGVEHVEKAKIYRTQT
jgi:hypothetical protein